MEVFRLRSWYGSNSHADHWWKPWFSLPVRAIVWWGDLQSCPKALDPALHNTRTEERVYGSLCVCFASRQAQGDVHSTLPAIEIMVNRAQYSMGFRVVPVRLWAGCLLGCKRRVPWDWRGGLFLPHVEASGLPCQTTWTTNAQEAYHHSFNALISCQHPSIWNLLDSLKKQQALTLNTIGEIQRGTTFRTSAKDKRRNDRILTLISQYTPATAERLLRGIAYNYF